MTNEDCSRIGINKYLEVLQLWCMKEYPFNYESVYKNLRGSALHRASYFLDHGLETACVEQLKVKTAKLVELLKFNPDSLFF